MDEDGEQGDGTMLCAQCNCELRPGAAFCVKCGAAVSISVEQEAPATRLPGFSMAVDVEIAHAAGTSPKRRPRAVVFAGVAALGVFVMVVVWHLISGGDQALEAGPQLAEPDVARAVDEAVPSRPSVPDGDALLHSLPQTGGAEPLLLEEHAASSAASASLPIGPAHSAGSAPAQGAEDEAYLRQIRQQFDRQKSW